VPHHLLYLGFDQTSSRPPQTIPALASFGRISSRPLYPKHQLELGWSLFGPAVSGSQAYLRVLVSAVSWLLLQGDLYWSKRTGFSHSEAWVSGSIVSNGQERFAVQGRLRLAPPDAWTKTAAQGSQPCSEADRSRSDRPSLAFPAPAHSHPDRRGATGTEVN
jgi:hypothetical protein